MSNLPVMFSTPMVIALIAGRKTETRRLANSPLSNAKLGDLLWIRESVVLEKPEGQQFVLYRADGHRAAVVSDKPVKRQGARPPIFMHRWASRITLEVTSVHIEHVQDISEADAIAGGLVQVGIMQWWHWLPESDRAWFNPWWAYKALWNSLHGEESWAFNPQVCVVKFIVHKENIDNYLKSKKKVTTERNLHD